MGGNGVRIVYLEHLERTEVVKTVGHLDQNSSLTQLLIFKLYFIFLYTKSAESCIPALRKEALQSLQPGFGKDTPGDDIEREFQFGQSHKTLGQIEEKWRILNGLFLALPSEIHYGSEILPVPETQPRAFLPGSFYF